LIAPLSSPVGELPTVPTTKRSLKILASRRIVPTNYQPDARTAFAGNCRQHLRWPSKVENDHQQQPKLYS
jgi:hypothetical protein